MAYFASYFNLKFSVISYGGLFLNNFILPLCIALFFAGLITERSFIKSFLQTSLMQLLGKSSYVFYLIHFGIINSWLVSIISTGNNYVDLFIIFISLNVISIMLFKIVEEPLNGYIRSILIPVKIKTCN